MLTWRDFLDYCDLTEEEVATIAHDEHLPPIAAAQLAFLRRYGLDRQSAALLRDRVSSPMESAPAQRPLR